MCMDVGCSLECFADNVVCNRGQRGTCGKRTTRANVFGSEVFPHARIACRYEPKDYGTCGIIQTLTHNAPLEKESNGENCYVFPQSV